MITDLLRQRYSVRSFQRRLIPDEVVLDIVEAGRLSPSGGNEQPWHFGVITDPTLIGEVAEAAHRQSWIARAPLIVALCVRIVPAERGGRDIQRDRFPGLAAALMDLDADLYAALNAEEHQTKIAGAHMALAALEHGIGATWVSRFDVERVAALLYLPTGVRPSELLIMGYPEGTPRIREKKPIHEIAFSNVFQHPLVTGAFLAQGDKSADDQESGS